MQRWTRPVAIALVGLLLGGTLVTVVAVADEDGGPTVNTADRPLDPVTYGVRAGNLCVDAVHGETGADELDAAAAAIAALPVSEAQAPMAQALVDGLADYAELHRGEGPGSESFSQAQNELLVVLDVRALGVGGTCADGNFTVVFPPEAPDAADLDAADDAELSATASDCFDGDLAACDGLVEADDPALRYYGVTCGGRLFHEEADDNYDCVETFASPRPVGDQR